MNTTTHNQPAIACQNIWKVFGPNAADIVAGAEPRDDNTVAVRDLTFEVAQGEKFVVMGLSGSGKSTLVRCLTRLIEPTSGSVWIQGQEITGMSAAELRELRRGTVSMVFQHFGLFAHKTVLGNAAYGLEVAGMGRREREAHARRVLDTVGLSGWESSYPSELSGGMKQRVGLARALASDADILLLDEPFSALDPLIRRELQDELLRLANEFNKTIVFITHDMSEALKIGDRIAIMRHGEIVQLGTPEDLLLRPVNDYVREFTANVSSAPYVRAETVKKDIEPISVDSDIERALKTMQSSDADHLFVTDPQGRPVGVVHHRDIHDTAPGARVEAIPLSTDQRVHCDDSLDVVAERVVSTGQPIAMVDDAGKFIGEVSLEHLVSAIADTGDVAAANGVR